MGSGFRVQGRGARKEPIEELGGSWMGSFQYTPFEGGLIGYRSQLLGFGVQEGWIRGYGHEIEHSGDQLSALRLAESAYVHSDSISILRMSSRDKMDMRTVFLKISLIGGACWFRL
jgi:hypothetical protein